MIPGSYDTAQYLLAIEPHQALSEEIIQVKKHFAATYECPAAAKGKPSIGLLRFEQFTMLEQRIVHRLQLIARAQPAFAMELNGFGSFPTHSIFIQAGTTTQFAELVRSLRPIQQLFKIDKEHKPHFITDPLINIARKLLPWQYEKGWLEMSNTHFSGRFIADKLVLLRKRGEGAYEPVKQFGLLNMREEIKQGELF